MGFNFMWVVVKIMVPFWVPSIIRHLISGVPKKTLILTITHVWPQSKILVSPLITPIAVPYIIPFIIPLRSLDYSSFAALLHPVLVRGRLREVNLHLGGTVHNPLPPSIPLIFIKSPPLYYEILSLWYISIYGEYLILGRVGGLV